MTLYFILINICFPLSKIHCPFVFIPKCIVRFRMRSSPFCSSYTSTTVKIILSHFENQIIKVLSLLQCSDFLFAQVLIDSVSLISTKPYIYLPTLCRLGATQFLSLNGWLSNRISMLSFPVRVLYELVYTHLGDIPESVLFLHSLLTFWLKQNISISHFML